MAGEIPLVSVLIPTFNAGRFVTAAIDSALRQTMKKIEVLVLDDGSTDDTVTRAKSFDDPRLCICEYGHRGAPAVLNAGLHSARGRYLGFLDHDDRWLPAKLDRHVEFLEKHPDVAVTFSWSGLIDEHDRRIRLHPPHWRGPIAFRQLLKDYVVGPSSSLVMRRSTVLSVGGFDVQLPRCHDFDLLLRIASAHPNGICAIPEELTLYRRHPGQMSRDWRAMDREWNIVFEKCRELAPADTAAVESRARSNINRYLAYLAYEEGVFPAARAFVRQALRYDPRAFVGDVRNWKIAAACCSESLLPATFHRRLEQLAGIHRD